MKIAFWSEQEGAGTTFNMAAIVSAAVMLYPVSAAVIAGGYDDSDLENQFGFQEQTGNTWRSQEKAAEQTDYFLPGGLDFLLHRGESAELTEQMIRANMKQVVAERLYCLPCGKKQYTQWWDKDTVFSRMEQVIGKLERCFELVFIDCGSRKDDFARKVLREADVCVLNMHQEEEQIGEYYRSRRRLKGKVFFLIGNYFGESSYNRRNLERIYRLEEKQLGAIPYNVQLQTAGQNGKAEKYIKNQLQQGCGLEFNQELVRSTRLIMQLAGIEPPLEEAMF